MLSLWSDSIFDMFNNQPRTWRSWDYANDYDAITAEDGSLLLTVDLPGIKLQDLNVEVNGKFITIKGERKVGKSSSTVTKSFTLHEKFDLQTLNAKLEDGVLTLTANLKKEHEKVIRKLDIKSS